jgi:hypothetical protein
MKQRVKLVRNLSERWIIVAAHEALADLAWSGARWVPIGGPVQICNFASRGDAEAGAESAGFEVVRNEILDG